MYKKFKHSVPKNGDRPLWIESAAQLRALASPVRQEIVDVLVSAGASSIAEIAAYLGRPPDALYFHVRRLLKARLLVECPPRKRGRSVAALYDVAGRPLRIRADRAPVAELRRVLGAAQRLGARDFGRACGRPFARGDGPVRNLWSGRAKGWVNGADLRRINRLTEELIAIVHRGRPGRGRNLQSFTFVLAPVPPNRRAVVTLKGGSRS